LSQTIHSSSQFIQFPAPVVGIIVSGKRQGREELVGCGAGLGLVIGLTTVRYRILMLQGLR